MGFESMFNGIIIFSYTIFYLKVVFASWFKGRDLLGCGEIGRTARLRICARGLGVRRSVIALRNGIKRRKFPVVFAFLMLNMFKDFYLHGA